MFVRRGWSWPRPSSAATAPTGWRAGRRRSPTRSSASSGSASWFGASPRPAAALAGYTARARPPTSGSARRCWRRWRCGLARDRRPGADRGHRRRPRPARRPAAVLVGPRPRPGGVRAARPRAAAAARRRADCGHRLPASWTAYPLGLLSAARRAVGELPAALLLNLAAFWVLDFRGFAGLYFVVVGLLCGLYVPVHLFPGWLAAARATRPRSRRCSSPRSTCSPAGCWARRRSR